MSTDKDIAISVKHVSKRFLLPHEKTASIKSTVVNVFRKKDRSVEVQKALKDISFDIKRGEFFGILGRNGSGKSTLLKILAEIYKPTSGEVSVQGKLVPFIELGVGFNPELTGRENVYLNGALLGFSKKDIDERYDDIVKFAELEEFMDQKLKNYSSGMQVRLAFSVATRAEADILLVDEVLAVGDADFQRKCYDYFKSLKKTGKTVVFVTHDMGAVREYCDRAILINEGVIQHEGSSDKVANEYLKLFNDSEKPEEVSESSDRWGNGHAIIESVKVRGTENLTIELVLASKTDKRLDGVNIGLRMRDQDDKLVAGTGLSRLMQGKALVLEPGEKKTIIYKLPNIFGRGVYSIDTTVMMADKVTICDDWTGAGTIKNNRKDSYYPVLLPAEVEIGTQA